MNAQKTTTRRFQDVTIHRYFLILRSMLLPHTNFRENPNKMTLISIAGLVYHIVPGVAAECKRYK